MNACNIASSRNQLAFAKLKALRSCTVEKHGKQLPDRKEVLKAMNQSKGGHVPSPLVGSSLELVARGSIRSPSSGRSHVIQG